MNELALFAGAGGGLLASKLLGWNTIGAVEIAEYPRKVLLQRQADGILEQFPIWDDIKTFDGRPWLGCVDIISGGFPCQDISAAGKGAGITGERSGLWFEMLRVIEEVSPSFVFAENSPLLRTRGLGTVFQGLDSLGYDARWAVLGAWNFGAPHRRNRLWIFAYPKRHKIGGESCCGTFRRMGWKQQPLSWDESWRDSLSRLRGMDDRVAGAVDRTDCIRNGQVPIVAAAAFSLLSDGIL